MKFAINTYAGFENSDFEYGKLRMDDIFVVSPEFEKNPAFIEGLRVGSFKMVEIETIGQLKKVVGVTDQMIEEFMSNLKAEEIVEEVVEETVPEPVPEAVPEPEVIPDVEEPIVESAPIPNLDAMGYRDLQAYAKEIEKKFGKDIDRSQKMQPLRESIEKILEEQNK